MVAYPEAIEASMVANNFFGTLRNEIRQPAMMGAPAGTPVKAFYPKSFALVSDSLPEGQAEDLVATMRKTYELWPNAELKFNPEKLTVMNGKVLIDLSYVPATSPKTSGKFDGIDHDMPGDGYLELTKESGAYKISTVSGQVGALNGCLWRC